ncbi:G-protein coupled receptor 4-like [Arapaima gigas]
MVIVWWVVNLTTFVIGLPVICLAIYVLYRQARENRGANVYVINLLITDLLQFAGRLGFSFYSEGQLFFYLTFLYGIVLSVGFMLCIAIERYLTIACPHWYSVHCTVKRSVLTSLVVWVVSIPIMGPILLTFTSTTGWYVLQVLLLLPFPLLVFLFVGTWRGLSKVLSLPSREKRRILAMLALVIGNYTFLFLPFILVSLVKEDYQFIFHLLGLILMCFSPLLDSVLYIFMRKDTRHILEDFPCCRKPHSESRETDTTLTVFENVTNV